MKRRKRRKYTGDVIQQVADHRATHGGNVASALMALKINKSKYYKEHRQPGAKKRKSKSKPQTDLGVEQPHSPHPDQIMMFVGSPTAMREMLKGILL